MAEDAPDNSTDDLELASELTRLAAEREFQDRLLDDSERTRATDEAEPRDETLGAVHLGSQGPDELSGPGADEGGGWDGFDVGGPVATDVLADRGWPQADVLAQGVAGSGVAEIHAPDGTPLATGGGTAPRPRIATEETEASALRIAPRLMPDSEAETEAQHPVAADTGEAGGGAAIFASPVTEAEDTTTDVGDGGNNGTLSGDQGSGGVGGEVHYGGSGKDSLVGGTGDDVLYGGGGKDTLDGGAGDDALYGGAGKDTLVGGAGDDYLSGGAGNDIAWGGDGADTYVFMEAMGNDIFHGGTGNWIDVVELQDTNGNAPTDGWSFGLTEGSVVSSGDGFVELSEDAAGTITLDDGSTLIFDGVEKFIW